MCFPILQQFFCCDSLTNCRKGQNTEQLLLQLSAVGYTNKVKGLVFFRRHNVWLITACKMYSNQMILSLKTENTWIEQDLCLQSKRPGEENKMNVFILVIKEQVHHDFSGVYFIK